MHIQKGNNQLRVKAGKYVLIIDRSRMLARLYLGGTDFYYHMSLLSAIDTVGCTDSTAKIKTIRSSRGKDHVLVEIVHSGSLWDGKSSYYKCYEDCLEYYVRVHGKGKIDRAYFFRGRLGENELGSVPGFDYFFPGCPNFLEKNYFHASEYCSINSGHEPFAWGYALSSGPLCFSFSNDLKAPWLSVGVAAKEGEYGFQSFEYNYRNESVAACPDSIVGTQAFSLAYYGHLKVNGVWETPHLVFNVGRDKYSSVKKYVSWLHANDYIRRPKKGIAPWWRGPIFCGWHEQVALAFGSSVEDLGRQYVESGRLAMEECTQRNYEKWLRRLENNGVRPGTIVIDAAWQIADDVNQVNKKKWPDLRGFIDKRHSKGQKVLLHMFVWKRTKSPTDECILLDGKPICPDPTNPKYIERVEREIQTMFSAEAGCYNADGLKVDGTSTQPYGYGLKTFGGLYGFDLQKAFLTLLYTQAKKIKPDALVSLFVANPYFADVCDMVRIGDMYTVKGDTITAMRARAGIAEIAMPGAVLDTDGQFSFCVEPAGVGELIREQAKLGVPTIYNAHKVVRHRIFSLPKTEELSSADYRDIAAVFKRHIKNTKGKSKMLPVVCHPH